jgi:hypothetical protein
VPSFSLNSISKYLDPHSLQVGKLPKSVLGLFHLF